MMPSRLFWRGALGALLLLVSVLAFSPGLPEPDVGHVDKLHHAVAFLTLAASACFAYPGARGRALLALLGYGMLIELVQLFIPYRSAEWNDVAADAVGIALGAMLAAAIDAAGRRLSR